GDIIGIQSSDDLYLLGAISSIVRFMNEHPDTTLAYGGVEYIDQDSRLLGRELLEPFSLRDYLGRFTYIPQPSAFFRSSVITEVGGWRKEVSYAADADYWLRIALGHKVATLDRVLAQYRYHPDQRDTQQSKISRDWERTVTDLLANNELDPSTRRAARMGIYLAKHRYTPESKWAARSFYLYRAALTNPGAIRDPRFPKRELLPGRRPVFKFLSRVKRALGFAPRGSQVQADYSTRQRAGALLYDLPRYLWGMRPGNSSAPPSAPWLVIRNRKEQLIRGPGGKGVQCSWQWTSDLHIAKVFPSLGLRLMNRAIRDWPIQTGNETGDDIGAGLRRNNLDPEVSFVIGHRGLERLPLLLATLGAISAQRDCGIECIVVEQSALAEIADSLPDWVRYIHTPVPDPNMPYCRAWAFNAGAREAKGKLLILHDNDLLAPRDYSAQAVKIARDGYEVINLKRFIFYLGAEHSKGVAAGKLALRDGAPETVMQNAEGGGSIAVLRRTYFELGGFDESFIGWGGEDNEFWERARRSKVWPYGYLPLVHLWHAPQIGRNDSNRGAAALLEARLAIPVEERIKELARNSRSLCVE
ncbi:MAG TPA: galactosyltransferase-related protein, partial [Blastocatellia bacterium]|nr:galactosyltransferase-related protein [Blastocatellia bacterium]